MTATTELNSKTSRVRLYHADCLALSLLDDIDAVVSDPQYQLANGKKAQTNHVANNRDSRRRVSKGMLMRQKDWGEMQGDDVPYDPSPWLDYPKVILWGAIHYAQRLPVSTSWLVWDKREGVAIDDNADCEMAWSNLGGPSRIHRQLWKGVCRRGEENISTAGEKLHPFQKPVALMSWCLRLAKLKPGATVIDPYMGSGTTGIACLRAGLNFIGVEQDAKHFATAKERIEAAQREGVLL